MEEQVGLPPPPEDNCSGFEECRLWIGNLDQRITEFTLLKLLQKYGELEKFDFLYHRSGPDQGKPRGYCFVTYKTKEFAEKAKRCLNGKLALSRRLNVKSAHTEKESDLTQNAASSLLFNSHPVTGKGNYKSTQSKIQEIESQLKQLEEKKHTDIDAFLPADKKKPQQNPLRHCIAGLNDDSSTSSTSKNTSKYTAKAPYRSRRNNSQRTYSKHKR